MSVTEIEEVTLDQMKKAVYDCNVANGWFDEERSLGTERALLHSEVAELFEAFRDWGMEDMTLEKCPFHEDFDVEPHLCKPEGVSSEAADILVRLLDTAHRHPGLGLTLPRTLSSTPLLTLRMDMPVVEFVDRLHSLIAGVPERYSLATVLSFLKSWCDMEGVDLQAEFDRKLAFNLTRGYRHGGKRV